MEETVKRGDVSDSGKPSYIEHASELSRLKKATEKVLNMYAKRRFDSIDHFSDMAALKRAFDSLGRLYDPSQMKRRFTFTGHSGMNGLKRNGKEDHDSADRKRFSSFSIYRT